jgi:hypothetical protein
LLLNLVKFAGDAGDKPLMELPPDFEELLKRIGYS